MPTNGKPFSKTEQKEQEARKKMNAGRDYPLATTPEPVQSKAKSEQRERAYSADMAKFGYVKDTTANRYK